MTRDSGKELHLRLRSLGLSDSAISAAWPRWWSEEADESPSARAELHFSVARRLGLDPRSLIDDREEPRFIWREEARFKHLSGESDLEQAGITSFGRAVASILIRASPADAVDLIGTPALQLRESMLAAGRPYVELRDLLSLAWGVGMPVAHLRVFPWTRKRMAAMTVRQANRWAVLLGKDSEYPPQLAFYLAHELGHVALGHLTGDHQIVDLEGEGLVLQGGDEEERDADAFALELLTGRPAPTVLAAAEGMVSAGELSRIALESAADLRIEPGTLALCFGYSTKDWQIAMASLRLIYDSPKPVWIEVNGIARQQLDVSKVTTEAADFLEAILAAPG